MPLKFTLQSIFTFMVIVALIVSVAVNLNRGRTITVMSYNYADAWQLLDSARDTSQWLDKSLPPPIGPEKAYAVSLNVAAQLEASYEALGLFDWKIESISLVPLGLEHNWAYVCSIYGSEFPEHLGVNNALSVQILIQMDGSVIFDPAQYPSSISDVMNGIAGIQFCPKPDARKLPDFDTLTKQIDDIFFSNEESPPVDRIKIDPTTDPFAP
jgi:hypothetical protein